MNVRSSGDSRSFAKELKAFKMRSIMASHQKLTVTIERIIKANPLTTTREVAKELNPDPSLGTQHLKQIGKVIKLSKWVPHELTENLKNWYFEVSSSLILYNSRKPFYDQIVTCDEKWILYDNWQQPAQ